MKVAVRARHLAVVGVAAGMTVLVTSVRRAQVAGGSMAPALLPGDRLVVVGLPWGLQPWPRVGAVVAVRDPRDSRRVLVKRVSAVDREAGTIFVVGDAPDVSTDSRTFGPVPKDSMVGRPVYRYGPPGRNGRGEWHEGSTIGGDAEP